MKIIKIILGVCMLVSAMGCTSQKNLVRGMDELVQKPSGPLVTPIWASSGDHVAASYIAYTEHRSTIYDFELKTHKSTILTSIEGKAVAQSWSMDESHLAITISESITFSNDGIWVFNIADSSYNYIGIGEAASWSPNGNLLAIYSCTELPDGNSRVATVRMVSLSQKKEEEILFREDGCLKLAYMSWSPDSKKIAFSFGKGEATQLPTDQIFVIDLSTKKTTRILGEGNWSPSFSPDSEKIVFVKNYKLGVSDKNGTCQVDVRDLGLEVVGDVSWSPDGTKWAISGLGRLYIVDVQEIMGRDFLKNILVCP
jgi:Tol biopolymer transport system component